MFGTFQHGSGGHKCSFNEEKERLLLTNWRWPHFIDVVARQAAERIGGGGGGGGERSEVKEGITEVDPVNSPHLPRQNESVATKFIKLRLIAHIYVKCCRNGHVH